MQPQLALTYDSGNGNGPFGIGWKIAVSSITRKTDKGLPRYIESGPDADVYVLTGTEDLVPVLEGSANWTHPAPTHTLPDGTAWIVERYRPRTDQLFARIERWTPTNGGAPHWRSLSKEGVISLYGTTPDSRIADPDDATHIFSWLITETYDTRGNAILFRYVAEDSAGIDLAQAHERNRTAAGRAANRYLKRVLYGNATPRAEGEDMANRTDWLFEFVVDYGEHDAVNPRPHDDGTWPIRSDPFSSYRSGFELRTYRLCQRLLMFHHFEQEPGVGRNCLVRSLELDYEPNPVATKLRALTLWAYRHTGDTYLKRSFPTVKLEYSQVKIQQNIVEVDAENLPQGIGGGYRLLDLDGEGLPGILTEQGSAWFYKRNVSPMMAPRPGENQWTAAFAPLETIATRPSLSNLADGRQQLMDLQGNGRMDLVQFQGPMAGYSARTEDGSWDGFRSFATLPNFNWSDSNLRFVDLTGNGHADVAITEEGVMRWHESLAEVGFGAEERVPHSFDEDRGPHLVFADASQSTYVADLSGDGLPDLVRIRNGEVCYWPNLGYGRFGAKVTMDNSPVFDTPEAFDQRRVRLADLDGSGTADLAYIGPTAVRLYANESGNRFADAQALDGLPDLADPAGIAVADLLGNGTSCLVWSCSLPGNTGSSLRYIDLMGGTKPHLLVSIANNLGAETVVHYVASTKFYVTDRASGRPWITRLAFPVQVVDRFETHDRISKNRFVTRYAYHHGYYDGVEREFRGFALVEQWDTEEFTALSADAAQPAANLDAASHVPPVLTKTWFHTGAYLDRTRISKQFAHEYYLEGNRSDGLAGLSDEQAAQMTLPDTVLPTSVLKPDGSLQSYTLLTDEEREACRALKGSILRQEVYGLDGSPAETRPYSVSERNYTVELLQPRGDNQHAVFLTTSRETIDLHYDRMILDTGDGTGADPRVVHTVTLESDVWGNPLRTAGIAYGRRYNDPDPALRQEDRAEQRRTLITYTDTRYTNSIDEPTSYRANLQCERRVYELLGLIPESAARGTTNLFRFDDLAAKVATACDGSHDIPPEAVDIPTPASPARRLIEHVRTIYRHDDLSGPLPLGSLMPRALVFETYRLALTAGLLATAYVRTVAGQVQRLISDPGAALGTAGGYLRSSDAKADRRFPAADPDDSWWQPLGRVFISPNPADSAADELAFAERHFFTPCRFRDAFGAATVITHDQYMILPLDVRDPASNRVTAGVRTADGIRNGNDYRCLQPVIVSDPNGNRSAVALDTRGLVVATAVMGRPGDGLGDALAGVDTDLTDDDAAALIAHPPADLMALIGQATMRIVYDILAYTRTSSDTEPQPAAAWTLTREKHVSDLAPGETPSLQERLSFSDGFGREVQQKLRAAPGPLFSGGPSSDPRYVVNGWAVFDNKGNPIRRYEPFFSGTRHFEFAKMVGISTILLRDPPGRVVATLHPNHTYEKVVFDPWRQEAWDLNDTALIADPASDTDVGRYLARLSPDELMPTWHQARIGGALGPDEQAAAVQTEVHAATPTMTMVDALGRPIITVAHNRFRRNGATAEERYCTRLRLDIRGQRLDARDPKGRLVLQSRYDLLGNRISESTMDAGQRWVLYDAAGKSLLSWDSRGHTVHTAYDALRRPVAVRVQEDGGVEKTIERAQFGETAPNAEQRNLRGKLYLANDSAGSVQTDSYDFKGNPIHTVRRFAKDYRTVPDWSHEVDLEDEQFDTSTTFDALNRVAAQTTPDGSEIRPSYDVRNLLVGLEAILPGTTAPTKVILAAEYDPKGQRQSIAFGNGVQTLYEYEPETFRLSRLVTIRETIPADCPTPGATPCGVQNLGYVYDPIGNVIAVRDAAQQTIFFANRIVDASSSFVYDAVYRVIAANGREHLGQNAAPIPAGPNDRERMSRPAPGDGNAMGRYREEYFWDEVANLLELRHASGTASGSAWTAKFKYAEPSSVDASNTGNRLSVSTAGTDSGAYTYDAHGNTTSMPHLPVMLWDARDRLRSTSGQTASSGSRQTTYYVYDAAGQRIRKVTDSQTSGLGPQRIRERIYIGPFERYREYDGGDLELERHTVHLMDGRRRIVLVERRVSGSDGTPPLVTRYQLSNQVDSSVLELSADCDIISYEEYYPFGATSYQAVRSQLETPKRYRYASKERDEESSLTYYGLRYYAPWLCRWTAVDPAGTTPQASGYLYARANPMMYTDPTGAHEESTHGALTYHLALAAGFTEEDAAHVGLATAGVDHDPATAPVGGFGGTVSNARKGVTAYYHFPSFATARARVDAQLARGSAMDLNDFGQALHTLEDVGFADAPGPHLRRISSTEVVFTEGVSLTISSSVLGVVYSEQLIPRISFTIPTLAQHFLGTPDSQQQNIGITHPFYTTERGNQSKGWNHVADQAYQDPVANTNELTRVYEVLKQAAAAHYGRDVPHDDVSAAAAIAAVTSADTEARVHAFLDRSTSFSGSSVNSYSWWVDHNRFTRVSWSSSQIDNSIVAPPPPRYLRSPDGTSIDTQTGRMIMGPGPKY